MRRDFWKKNGLAVTGILCLLIAWQGRAMETVTGQESVVPEQQEARKVALTFDDDVIIGLSQEISYKEAVSMV